MLHSVHNHPNGKQAKALQLLCHIIKREEKLTVPKNSLRNHPSVLPTPLLESPLPPKEAPPEVNQWAGLLVEPVAPAACLCPHCFFVSRQVPHFPSCRWLAASIVSLTGPVQTTELGTTFKPPICQRLFIRSKACSRGLMG